MPFPPVAFFNNTGDAFTSYLGNNEKKGLFPNPGTTLTRYLLKIGKSGLNVMSDQVVVHTGNRRGVDVVSTTTELIAT